MQSRSDTALAYETGFQQAGKSSEFVNWLRSPRAE